MIELIDVTQHYGVRPVLKNISLTIEAGELVVVVGPNGMGKSTLMGVMGGVLAPQRGSVRINGRVRRSSEEDELAIRRAAVFLPDQPWLPQLRTAREYLLAIGRLYDIPEDRLFIHIEKLLELFELAKHGDQPLRNLSSGQKKKAALCGALVTDAPTLMLDEPFSGGLDPAGLLALKRVLRRRATDGEGCVVLTSPVPEIVEEIADRIVILKNGEILAFDSLQGLRRTTGLGGSLGEILERLLYPETTQKLQHYFDENSA